MLKLNHYFLALSVIPQLLVVWPHSQTSPPAGIWPGNETAPWYLMYSTLCSVAWSCSYMNHSTQVMDCWLAHFLMHTPTTKHAAPTIPTYHHGSRQVWTRRIYNKVTALCAHFGDEKTTYKYETQKWPR